MKKWIWFFSITVLLAALAIAVPAQKKPISAARTVSEITYELVKSYEVSPTLSEKKVEALLQELEITDPDAAVRWRDVMSCWKDSGSDMLLNFQQLPDGLPSSDSLCIIVLGYQLNPDGSMKEELIGRLNAAKASAEKYPKALILCTGGGTAAASATTEAAAMAAWLEENGIDENRILIEANSLTTTENAIYCARLLRERYPAVTQAVLVSSDYHIPWAYVLFQSQFILADQGIRLVSNAAYQTATKLPGASLLRYQANGILEIASHI